MLLFSPSPPARANIKTCLSHPPGHSFRKRKVSQHGARQRVCAHYIPARDNRNCAGSETTITSQVFTYIAEYRYKLAEKWKQSRVDTVCAMQAKREKYTPMN